MSKAARRANRVAREQSFAESLMGQSVDRLCRIVNAVGRTAYAQYKYSVIDTLESFTTKLVTNEAASNLHATAFLAKLKILESDVKMYLFGEGVHDFLKFFPDRQKEVDAIRYKQNLLVASTATKELILVDMTTDFGSTIFRGDAPNIRRLTVSLADRKYTDGILEQTVFTSNGLVSQTGAPVMNLQTMHEVEGDNLYSDIFERMLIEGTLADAFNGQDFPDPDYSKVRGHIEGMLFERDFAIRNNLTVVGPLDLQEFTGTIASTFGVAA